MQANPCTLNYEIHRIGSHKVKGSAGSLALHFGVKSQHLCTRAARTSRSTSISAPLNQAEIAICHHPIKLKENWMSTHWSIKKKPLEGRGFSLWASSVVPQVRQFAGRYFWVNVPVAAVAPVAIVRPAGIALSPHCQETSL